MSDTEYDVVIAAYLIRDLADDDFQSLVDNVASKKVDIEGVALVTVDPEGVVAVKETGDHLGRKGAKVGGGVGLAVGLLSPPLLAATVVGAAAGGVVGKFARHKITSGIGDKMGAALPPGSPGIIAVYDRVKADLVTSLLASAVRTSVAEVDGGSAKELKAALAEAQAGMAGG